MEVLKERRGERGRGCDLMESELGWDGMGARGKKELGNPNEPAGWRMVWGPG